MVGQNTTSMSEDSNRDESKETNERSCVGIKSKGFIFCKAFSELVSLVDSDNLKSLVMHCV